MGSGYKITCKKCGYEMHAMLGIGMTYPRACASALDSMKEGKFGILFRDAALATPHAAVNTARSLYRCATCGRLSQDMLLELCAPIGEYKPRDTIFSSACPRVEGYDYVMESDIGKRYKVLVSLRHPCGTCGRDMQPVRPEDKPPCPECKTPLTVITDICWD